MEFIQLLWAVYSSRTARRVKSGSTVAALTSGTGRKLRQESPASRGALRKDASAITVYRELQYYSHTQ